MDSSFWNGFKLQDFLFKSVHITTPLELVAVCFITAAIAFTFEGTRTLRDWLYMEYLKKRSCDATSGGRDTPMALHQVQSRSSSNGSASAHTDSRKTSASERGSDTTPVIATGTISGHGKACQKPGFQVGLVELGCSTVLHMSQVVLGYVLMLVVMTFNVWIFISVLIGTSIGFFVFDAFNKKVHSLRVNAKLSK